MPTSLEFSEHLAILQTAAESLAVSAETLNPHTSVPTCPGWDVTALVSHQGGIHRWAAGTINGTFAELDKQGREAATAPPTSGLIDWYRDGVAGVVTALQNAPDDLDALVFLQDAPPARRFWARRQAHETTIHAVDAFGAVLGRVPTAAEVGLEPAFAADGVDELILGFIPRPRTKLRALEPYSVAVVPDDWETGWTLAVGPDEVTTAVARHDAGTADAVFHGSAAELYLGLWNRGEEFRVSGSAEVVAQWRREMRI